ncbi:MAG: hypothetical protein LUG83_05310, partial [Lachnospiraceae bacterium]|nr:hypothetical protein [Lachnospiraceae bacterium]
MDYTSEYIRSFHIADNDLVLYWKGLNMTDLSKQLPDVSIKEYYQFEKPLFLNSNFSIEQLIQYNKFFFNKIGFAEDVDMSLLIDNPYFVLATVSKKAIASLDE